MGRHVSIGEGNRGAVYRTVCVWERGLGGWGLSRRVTRRVTLSIGEEGRWGGGGGCIGRLVPFEGVSTVGSQSVAVFLYIHKKCMLALMQQLANQPASQYNSNTSSGKNVVLIIVMMS